MKFILYSRFTEEVIQDHLGEREYGYFFVLRAFQRVLADLGSIEVVRHPETEVDPIFKACRANGEPCLFFAFAPPNKIPLALECPTVPVIAWEFSTIPDGAWDKDARHDWRFVLGRIGRAIALSRFSARVIAEAMGPEFKISVVPVPMRRCLGDAVPADPFSGGADIDLAGNILDTAAMNLRVDILAQAPPESISSCEIESAPAAGGGLDPVTPPGQAPRCVSPGGIIYTAVLNQNDGSKNPRDLVTAFCWAFRETSDATLVLKVCNLGLPAFHSVLVPLLYKLSPFKCRVLVVPEYLPDSKYERLIQGTTFYVNASVAEGMGMPLMEFMACGKPAIAPLHTAMSEYVDGDVAFIVRSSPQMAAWPDDPRGFFRTMSFRVDWGSLLEAYRQSYRLVKNSPEDYRKMSKRARERIRGYASPVIVGEQLRRFLLANPALTAGDQNGLPPAIQNLAGQ
jgi:hypothetical protein